MIKVRVIEDDRQETICQAINLQRVNATIYAQYLKYEGSLYMATSCIYEADSAEDAKQVIANMALSDAIWNRYGDCQEE